MKSKLLEQDLFLTGYRLCRPTKVLKGYIFTDSINSFRSRLDKFSSLHDFYPRDAMLARVFAIATCLSLRLSVRRAPVLCLADRKQDREMYTI